MWWVRSDVKVFLRSDQDVTLTLILRDVQARRQQRTLVKRSPVGSHAIMGVIERANSVTWERCCAQSSTRLRRELERRLGTDHSFICWKVRHCCWIFCRPYVRADGRTPFEVLRNNQLREVRLACFFWKLSGLVCL